GPPSSVALSLPDALPISSRATAAGAGRRGGGRAAQTPPARRAAAQTGHACVSVTAYIGLGGNLGDPADRLRAAAQDLAAIPQTQLKHVSSLYRSPPPGPPDQPHYVNAVAALETALAPEALLDALQALEARHGRVRDGQRWGPRTLDLDLLLYGAAQLATPRLTVPHPGL